MRIYLSLPITGYNEQERRTYAARTCGELTYLHEDWEIVNPFMIADRLRKERLQQGDFSLPSYDELMDADLEQLRKCDCVLFCPKWTESEGCKMEYGEAVRLGIRKACLKENMEVYLMEP